MTRPDVPSIPDPLSGRPFDAWNFRPDVAVEISGAQLRGYKLEATDGSAGKVTDFGLNPDDSFMVASTGRLLGATVLVPAGTVSHIDHGDRKIYLDRAQDQVKQAPEVPDSGAGDPEYRDQVADYYRATYASTV